MNGLGTALIDRLWRCRGIEGGVVNVGSKVDVTGTLHSEIQRAGKLSGNGLILTFFSSPKTASNGVIG